MVCNRTLAVCLTVCLGLVAGCSDSGGKKDGGAGGTPSAKEALTDLAAMLKHLDETKKKMPMRLQEMEPVEPLFPGAYVGLTNGSIVYVWGAKIDPAQPGNVIAYEKAGLTDGGWVLMQDGNVKQLKADELSSAPKGK